MMKWLSVFLIVLSLGALGCAGKREPGRAKPPADSRQAPVGADEDELTPQRAASNALIDDGEKTFAQGRYDAAADLFQQAVTVDPTNGAAYYHLALAKVRSGEYGEAEGLIEKADQLLGGKAEWAERLEELKRDFDKNKSSKDF